MTFFGKSANFGELTTNIKAQWRMFVTRRRFNKMKEAEIIISSNFKMWKTRREFQKQKNAAITIQSYQRGMEARKLLRAHKQRKREILAVTTIAAHWRGLCIRRVYAKKFRRHAAPIIARFMETYATRKYLIDFRNSLPTSSPIDNNYNSPKFNHFNNTHQILKHIHHKWRCKGIIYYLV